MIHLGLIGVPLQHSFSKKYFDEKIISEGLTNKVVFDNYELASIDLLPELLRSNTQLKGLAVTIPYKKKVIWYLDDATDEVKKMVACNCIKIEQGSLHGFNTDVIGFEKSLLPKLEVHHDKALILGTGGAGSAVAYVLEKLAIPFKYVSRRLVDQQTISYAQLNQFLPEYKLIINTTPLGTFPKLDQTPELPFHLLTPEHHCFDLIYNPAETLFLKEARKHGASIQNGLEMLHIQAEENWKIWMS